MEEEALLSRVVQGRGCQPVANKPSVPVQGQLSCPAGTWRCSGTEGELSLPASHPATGKKSCCHVLPHLLSSQDLLETRQNCSFLHGVLAKLPAELGRGHRAKSRSPCARSQQGNEPWGAWGSLSWPGPCPALTIAASSGPGDGSNCHLSAVKHPGCCAKT